MATHSLFCICARYILPSSYHFGQDRCLQNLAYYPYFSVEAISILLHVQMYLYALLSFVVPTPAVGKANEPGKCALARLIHLLCVYACSRWLTSAGCSASRMAEVKVPPAYSFSRVSRSCSAASISRRPVA